MDFAHGRASVKFSNGIGPISPVRWHSWQCFCRIGATSLENVGVWATEKLAVARARKNKRICPPADVHRLACPNGVVTRSAWLGVCRAEGTYMTIRQTLRLGVAASAATLGGWWYMHASM